MLRAVERAEPLAQRVDVERSLRRVLVLAVAALLPTTAAGLQRATSSAAPTCGVRTTIRSGRYADSVWTVSLSDSPFSTLEPLEAKLITSALSVLAASSKLERVRVEAS